MNFDVELLKRNVMLVVLAQEPCNTAKLALVAYLLVSRVRTTAYLHKLLVLEHFRHHGLAKQLVNRQIEELRHRGCVQVQFWVDENRQPARNLYRSIGFEEIERIENYYAPGRAGINMALSLIP